MKTSTKLILGGVVMLLATYAVLQWTDKTATPPKPTVSIPSSTTKVSTQMIDAIPIEPLEPAPRAHSDSVKAAPIPPELKGATDDPATAAFWLKYDPKIQEFGAVKDTANHTQQLFVGGKVVFEASQILRVRTVARDGTVALAAIIEAPSGTANKADEPTKPSTIWVIDPSGLKRQVSPPNVNASTPLISPDSKRIAFTGVSVGTDGSEEAPLLWVYDLTTKQYRKFAPSQKRDNYSVGAAEWSEDGHVLYVLEDYGETRGHMVMRAINL